VGGHHDYIRGIPGNFEKALKLLADLKKLQKKYSNLTVGIHSVISQFNHHKADELYDWAFSMKPDQYITEIAEERAELDTKGESITPSAEDYSQAIDKLINRVKKHDFQGVSKITEAFRLEYYKNVKKYLKSRKQVIPCYAGWASGQIYANGDVWQCCIDADVMGNLRDNDYNFRRIWFSKKADEIRKKVKSGGCGCPLANASYTNMLMDFKTLTKVISNYL
jgi:MoaA/NifB/PqqE/SkfB family radical SAM enzyme